MKKNYVKVGLIILLAVFLIGLALNWSDFVEGFKVGFNGE